MAINHYHPWPFPTITSIYSIAQLPGFLYSTPLILLLPSARVTSYHLKFYFCLPNYQLPPNASSPQGLWLVSGISHSQCLPLLIPEKTIIFFYLGKKGRKPKSSISELSYTNLFCSKCSFQLQLSNKQLLLTTTKVLCKLWLNLTPPLQVPIPNQVLPSLFPPPLLGKWEVYYWRNILFLMSVGVSQ